MIELLVVISIIALLIGILLPALGAARGTARKAVCLSNQRQVAVAMNTYVAEFKESFPAAYVYPSQSWDGTGRATLDWRWIDQQGSDPPEGYLHWSYALFAGGSLGLDAFQCPSMESGGHPATNAGPNAPLPDGYASGNGDVDAQVDTVALTANEMIIPRNKFSVNPVAGRNNQLVRASWVTNPSSTIMVTEFIDHYPAIATNSGVSKSHRSVNPIIDGFGSPSDSPTSKPVDQIFAWQSSGNFGLAAYDDILSSSATQTDNPVNMIGRHHAGGGSGVGEEGTTNFVRIDGSGFSDTVRQSIADKQWGDKFYSLTGEQRVGFDQGFD